MLPLLEVVEACHPLLFPTQNVIDGQSARKGPLFKYTSGFKYLLFGRHHYSCTWTPKGMIIPCSRKVSCKNKNAFKSRKLFPQENIVHLFFHCVVLCGQFDFKYATHFLNIEDKATKPLIFLFLLMHQISFLVLAITFLAFQHFFIRFRDFCLNSTVFRGLRETQKNKHVLSIFMVTRGCVRQATEFLWRHVLPLTSLLD